MPIQLPDARQLSDEALQVLRLRALRGIELGFSEVDLAELLGVCHETISRWWTAYRAEGLDSLPGGRTGRPLGSGRSLSEQQAERIQGLIDDHSPAELGIAHALWTRRAVRDLIRKEFGIDLAERTVGLYLRRWGYTSKKPARHSRKQDPDEVEHWLEETYPAIEAQAAEEGGEILWTDEVGVEADHHPGCGYAREGERATMEVPGPHIRVNQISAISNEGTVRFMTYKGSLNAAVFLAVPGQADRGGEPEDPPDRGPAAGAQDAGGGGLGGGAQGPDRGVLPAGLLAGDEPGGVPEQRHEGGGEQGRPAGRQGSLARADPGVHETPGQRAQTCHQLLSPSRSSICRRH